MLIFILRALKGKNQYNRVTASDGSVVNKAKQDIFFKLDTIDEREGLYKQQISMSKKSSLGANKVLASPKFTGIIDISAKTINYFMFRRTALTRNLQGVPINVVSSTYEITYRLCRLRVYQEASVAEAEQRYIAASRDRCSGFNLYEKRIYATLPGLATLKANLIERNGLVKYGNQQRDNFKFFITRPHVASIFTRKIKQIVENSAKFKEVTSIYRNV